MEASRFGQIISTLGECPIPLSSFFILLGEKVLSTPTDNKHADSAAPFHYNTFRMTSAAFSMN